MNGLQRGSALTRWAPGSLVCTAAVSDQISPWQRQSPSPWDCGQGSRASVSLEVGYPSEVAAGGSWASWREFQLQMNSLRTWNDKEFSFVIYKKTLWSDWMCCHKWCSFGLESWSWVSCAFLLCISLVAFKSGASSSRRVDPSATETLYE